MAKRYARVNFQNRPSVATPLNAINLNKLDKGIDDIDNALETANSAIATLDTGKIGTSNIANNLATTAAGLVLDARQGKVLSDSVNEINNKIDYLGSIIVPVIFGSNMHPSGYYEGFIFIPRCDLYTVTISFAVAQGIKILDLSTIATSSTRVGMLITCTDITVVGRAVEVSLTLS